MDVTWVVFHHMQQMSNKEFQSLPQIRFKLLSEKCGVCVFQNIVVPWHKVGEKNKKTSQSRCGTPRKL